MKKFLFIPLLIISAVYLFGCEGKGKIVIKEPPNAKVYIDGKYVGTTPLELTLTEGKYKVTVETTEFDSETKTVQVFFDRVIELIFQPKPKGILKADSIPKGAKVIEGKVTYGKTPLSVKLDPGEHLIVFKHGSLGASRKVNIEYKKVTEIFVNLEKAVIHFNLNPPDAELYVDGKRIEAPATVELEEGVHKAEVKKGVYQDKFKFSVKKGEEKNITYTLKDVQLPPIQAYAPIEFTKDYKFLVSLGKGGIYLWDLKDFKPHISVYDPQDVRNFDRFSNFDVSDNNKLIAGVKPIIALKYTLKYKDRPATKILIWNAETLSPVFSKVFYEDIVGVSFSKDNKSLFMATNDGRIIKLDIKDGSTTETDLTNLKLTDIKRFEDRIFISSEGGRLFAIDSKTGELLLHKKVHDSKINRLEISKDGSFLITSSDDGRIHLINRNLNIVDTIDIGSPVLAANLSISDDALAYSIGKTVKVISATDKYELYTIKGFNGDVVDVEFWTDEILITASGIKTPEIKLWNKGHLLRKWVQTIE